MRMVKFGDVARYGRLLELALWRVLSAVEHGATWVKDNHENRRAIVEAIVECWEIELENELTRNTQVATQVATNIG